ncbi:hypothetical protein P9B03_07515 [Metasolibacillus meyeri]|uniref:Uncharacterized protein n=1 Tax=Metasolibacillus meyeri TaxID=1071052 RepID=A0AAW9NQP5_9BACL|nr:hypothetical protein [Metasolibacillus meyeri]MEC1178325.1 hypothetical protein [Metasolibacillus meyeri]
MEKQLKDLSHTMDQSIFRDAQFTGKEQSAIRAKTQQKKQARWMPRIVISLATFIFLLIGTIYLQNERSANYRISAGDWEGNHFQSEKATTPIFTFMIMR